MNNVGLAKTPALMRARLPAKSLARACVKACLQRQEKVSQGARDFRDRMAGYLAGNQRKRVDKEVSKGMSEKAKLCWAHYEASRGRPRESRAAASRGWPRESGAA
eukprot:2279731-Pleurochrysis_carterae.AAC.1